MPRPIISRIEPNPSAVLTPRQAERLKQVEEALQPVEGISDPQARALTAYNNQALHDVEQVRSIPVSRVEAATGIGADALLDGLQTGLDMLGFLPGVGAVFDVASALISFLRGNYVAGAISLVAAIPVVGDALGITGKAIRKLDDALPAIRHGVGWLSERIDQLPRFVPSWLKDGLRSLVSRVRSKLDELGGVPRALDPDLARAVDDLPARTNPRLHGHNKHGPQSAESIEKMRQGGFKGKSHTFFETVEQQQKAAAEARAALPEVLAKDPAKRSLFEDWVRNPAEGKEFAFRFDSSEPVGRGFVRQADGSVKEVTGMKKIAAVYIWMKGKGGNLEAVLKTLYPVAV